MGAQPGGHATRATAGHLLDQDRLKEVAGAGAPVLLLELVAEELQPSHPAKGLVGEVLGLLPILGVWQKLLGHERTNAFAVSLVVFIEDEVALGHGALRPGGRPSGMELK